MKAVRAPLSESEAFDKLHAFLDKPFPLARVTDCAEAAKCHLADALGKEFKYRLIITYADLRAREICEDYAFYDKDVVFYPAKDLVFYQADIHAGEIVRSRLRCLRQILSGRPVTVVTTFSALLAPMAPLAVLNDNRLRIDKNETVEVHGIVKRLVTMGYERCAQAEMPGQFSVRGDIIDIYDLTADNPYRIELWGDEVESVRRFDASSQRSLEQLDSAEIFPATEMLLTDEELEEGVSRIDDEMKRRALELRNAFKTEEAHRLERSGEQQKEQLLELGIHVSIERYIRYFYQAPASFIDLFPGADTCVFMDEPSHIQEHMRAVRTEFTESMIHRAEQGYALPGEADLLFDASQIAVRLSRMKRILLESLSTSAFTELFPDEADHCRTFSVRSRGVAPYNNSFETLVRDLKRYRKEGYRTLILSGSRARAKRLVEDLRDNDVTAFYSEDPSRVLQNGEVMTYYGRLRQGFAYDDIRLAVISESDIFSVRKKKHRKKSRYSGEQIAGFADLKIGDLVVHEDHGLGIYRGVEKIEVDKVVKDYIKIEYAGGGYLYVLATALSVIQKYASGKTDEADGGKKPKLNRLGTNEWTRTREKVQSAVDEIAEDLVALYAKRSASHGYAFSRDSVWQSEFEDAFPYEETDDQIAAIEDMKHDMESDRIMDRLLCGDVGFGKTEVAIRGAFKAVQDSKQVAVLVPTTILAQQHFNTFTERFQDFPVRIDLLSRFRTPSEQKRTVEDLRKGMVDIVIGTHRLLSKDVSYKDLGLLVVDEEQRFGVSHKEKIKKLKETVDVLTLTATPIPRTLHMSLVGIRDMSLLAEAPLDRLPIQTFVCEQNDEIVREAVLRELSRRGQVYYVYNRVNTIPDIAARIGRLVPEARVGYAHGQMPESELERIMYEFIGGQIDVLVSTTIIETGLDIPNVNTMIIHDSDKMGLAQLYQLRGRVGRSNRTAYAFLMYKRDRVLREVAEKRLNAIREFTDLGSGYKIAMRDLEIRGAGNLLGARQSGHMATVGYEMYCRMLEDAIRQRKGGEGMRQARFTTAVDLPVDVFIPGTYILNEEQKLEIYKRIAAMEQMAEADDMRDELRDRFGEVPASVENLIRVSAVRMRANALFITEIKGGEGETVFSVRKDAQIDPSGIPALLQRYRGALRFRGGETPAFIYTWHAPGGAVNAGELLLSDVEIILADMQKTFGTEAQAR